MTVRPPDRGYIVKGWCPAPGRPMESGDGWLLRLKPFGGILTAQQAAAIAAVARELGNGQLDLTNRGALQLRGIARDRLAEAGAALDRIGLAQGGALAAITIAPQLGQEDGSDPGGSPATARRFLRPFPICPRNSGSSSTAVPRGCWPIAPPICVSNAPRDRPIGRARRGFCCASMAARRAFPPTAPIWQGIFRPS
ncbi:hypothetical protein QWZ10_09385 [Paracoccus cavernae]|uniref:Nitrite/Sulfite reductase ferredoxin-like domain-containing protein n=1 Tax=Paracoccus cavernae TaxID=1571207 RepID=A0ABT8D6H0_9RHOB|nr:hypothetical protein [Paracoccus cavernae]